MHQQMMDILNYRLETISTTFLLTTRGGWQNWETSTKEVFLEVGVYDMEFIVGHKFLKSKLFRIGICWHIRNKLCFNIE